MRENVGRLTESTFRRLEVAWVPLGYIYYEVLTARSPVAEIPRLTENAFRRLEVATYPLGYI